MQHNSFHVTQPNFTLMQMSPLHYTAGAAQLVLPAHDPLHGRPCWLLDFGVSRHMTSIFVVLFNVHAISSCYIGPPNGHKVWQILRAL